MRSSRILATSLWLAISSPFDDGMGGAEFVILIGDAWQQRGVGTLLLETLLTHARSAGLARLHGITYSTNTAMIDLERKLGFELINVPSDSSVREVVKVLKTDDLTPRSVARCAICAWIGRHAA
jgi:GNAT superfamily N-acetyltransferase